MEFERNPQLRELPAQLPSFVRGRTALVAAAAEDASYSPTERLSTLMHLAARFFGRDSDPGERDPILASVLAHRMARLTFQLPYAHQERFIQSISREDNPLAGVLIPFVKEHMHQLKSIELANIVWAAAVLRISDPNFWTTAASQTERVANTLTAHGLANVAWAFMKQAITHPGLYESLAERASHVISGSRAQVLSTLALTFSKAKIDCPGVFRVIGAEFIRRMPEASTKNISNVLMAFSTAQFSDSKLFNVAASELLKRSTELNSRDIASCYWSLAKTGIWREDLFDFFSGLICQKILEFSAPDLCTISWSLGMTRRQDISLFKALSQAVKSKVSECTFVGLSNVANACADCSIRDQSLMVSLADEVVRRGPGDFRSELSSIAWSMATVGIHHEAFFNLIVEDSLEKAAELEPRHLVLRTWALAFGKPDSVVKICSREKLDTLVDEGDWMQVYEALLSVGIIHPDEKLPRLQEVEKSNRVPPLSGFELAVERDLLASGFLREEISPLPVISGKFASFMLTRGTARVALRCLKDRKHRALGPDGDCLMGRDIIQERAWARGGVQTVYLFESEYRSGGIEGLSRRLGEIF